MVRGGRDEVLFLGEKLSLGDELGSMVEDPQPGAQGSVSNS